MGNLAVAAVVQLACKSLAAALARRVLTVLTGNWSGCWQAGRHLLVPRQCFVDKPWRACCRACAAG